MRGRVWLAFLAFIAVLGAAAIFIATESGQLIAQGPDDSVAAVATTRLAAADFASLRLLLSRSDSTGESAAPTSLDARLSALAQTVESDLEAAREQAGSVRANLAATAALAEFRSWNALRLGAANNAPGSHAAMDQRADALGTTLVALGELATADGQRAHAQALSAIRAFRLRGIAAVVVAMLIGVLLAARLARHAGRLTALARAAERIAAGDMQTSTPPAGSDELGQLAASVATLRDRIRNMADRQGALRRSVQDSLVGAIAGLHEGVALIGQDGRVVVANSQLTEFFPQGFAASARPPPEIDTALTSPTGEMRLGDGRWLRCSRSVTDDGGYVLVAHDITVLKEREALLRAAKEQAEAADLAKTEFLTKMSHELRTPLTAIIGFSEMIANESFGPIGQPKYHEFAADILHSGRHLLDIINDILDIAKLQSGTTTLRLQRVMSRSIVDDAIRIVRKKAEQAGVSLELDVQRDAMILADQLRLRQVLLNLLSNAIKFTPAGGNVSVIVQRGDLGLSITVRDTGIGMAPEDIPRVLQPFVQVDNGLARHHSGTGLGLPLSKLFVELHGGRFSIHSKPGHGTAVTLAMPTVSPSRHRIAA